MGTLTSGQVLVSTSNDGYKTHLRGVAAMMQNRGPSAFQDGVAHLMFVGVRPLLVSNLSWPYSILQLLTYLGS